MKRLFFIFCIFYSFIFGFAQDEETLMNDLFQYLDAGQHEKVIELGSQLLSRMNEVEVENEEDKKDLEIFKAGLFMVLAESYVAQQDYNKAIELGTHAVEINKRTLGENNPHYTSSLFGLSCYYYNGDYAMAIELGTQALEITKRVPGEDPPNYALSIGVLADSYSALGDYTKAIEMETQAVEINKRTLGENHPYYTISLNNLVKYYSNLGNNNKAIASLLQSLVVQKTVLNNSYTVHTDSATFCNILLSVTSIIDSDTCYNQFYSDASQLIIESMPIIRGIYDTDSEEYCRYLSYLFRFALFGMFTNIDHTYEEKSFDYLISMLESDLANVKKNKYEFYSMLSGAYEKKKNKEKAIEYGEKKLQEALNHYISDREKITYTYSLLISMYSRFNDVKRTESLLHEFLNYFNGNFTNDDINPITGIINGLPVALYNEFMINLIDIYASGEGQLSDIKTAYCNAATNNKVSILKHIENRMIPHANDNERFDFYEEVGLLMCTNNHINDGIKYTRKAIEYANSIDKREWNYSLGKSEGGKDIIRHLYSRIAVYQSDPLEITTTYELMKQEMKQDLYSETDLDKDLLYVSYADMLQSYSVIVDIYFHDNSRCIDLNTEALDMLSKSRFEDSFKELKGSLLRGQIGCFKVMHNYVYYEKGLLLCDSILCLKDNLIPDDTLYNFKGQIYDNMKMYAESQTMYILAIQSAKSINDQYTYKRNLASSFIDSGNYKKGIELLEDMVNNPDTTASNFEKFSLYESLGHAYSDISPELALVYYDKAETIELEPSNRYHLVVLYQKKASLYSHIAKYSKQKECLDKAVALYKELNLNDPHLNAHLLSDLADFYYNVNDVKALDQYILAKEAFDKANISLDDPSFEGLMNNMAFLLDNETAIKINTALCESRKNEYGTDHPLYATSLNNLAFSYYENENYAKAIELGTQALEISKKIYGENHEDYIHHLINLADYYFTSGNKSEYIKLSDQALAISKNVLPENHHVVEAILGSRSYYYKLEGDLKMANKYYSKMLYANYLTLLHNFNGLSSAYRTSLWSKYADFFQHYPNHIDNSNESIGDLYDKSCLFAKGLLLSAEMEMRKLIMESGDQEAVSKFEHLLTTRAWLNTLYEQPFVERKFSTDSLERVAERLETELVQQSQVYGDFMHNLKLTWRDVQAKLGDKDMAVEFLSFPVFGSGTTQYIALAVKKGYDAPHMVKLFTDQELQAVKSSYYKKSELSQMVWGKMADELEGVENIYFSPSGELYNIAIESMPHWTDSCRMSDRFNLYRLSSTRELAINRSETKSSGAVIYGGIHFDTNVANMGAPSRGDDVNYIAFSSFTPDSVFTRGTIWGDLPGTLVEANEVYDILKSANRTQEKPLTGEKATETSFKQLSGQKKRILHIATHGFYWSESRAESKKEMLRFLQMDGNHPRYVEDKAMTRSGLIFAGANNTFRGVDIPAGVDDGVLTAQEISQLDLRGLDLLVLSACKTGLGEIKGDGVFGLQRGFKKAGAQTIMMSLRDVEDNATKDMMIQFYKALTSGKTKREAFIQAQQYLKDHDSEYKYKSNDLREQFPHWAAFILLDAK